MGQLTGGQDGFSRIGCGQSRPPSLGAARNHRNGRGQLIHAETAVPFVDMQAVNAPYRRELGEAFERVLDSGIFAGGPEVVAFEAALASQAGTTHAVGVSSGTSALQLILEAAGIGRGYEVILPANTFFATAEAVVSAGATPVLVDADEHTALIDPRAVSAAVTSRTGAVIAVHLYGQPADVSALSEITQHLGLALIEDAAQAIGASWCGRPVGSLSLAAGFSFYPAKNLGALGDAGAVTTSAPEIAARVAELRNHGSESKYIHRSWGYNHRMDALQAAFLAVKLRDLGAAQAERDRAVARYQRLLGGIPGVERLRIDPRGRHVHHLMVVKVARRDAVLARLRARGIDAAIHYPVAIHQQPAYRSLSVALQAGSLERSERLAGSILSLPLYAGMSDAQVDRCVSELATAVEMSDGTA
jgi:dTDP-4-amino-4,6-dideoxygalactose transaminase